MTPADRAQLSMLRALVNPPHVSHFAAREVAGLVTLAERAVAEADVLAAPARASVLAAELAARAALEAHDPEAWALVAVAQRRRRIVLAADAPDSDAGGGAFTVVTSAATPTPHEGVPYDPSNAAAAGAPAGSTRRKRGGVGGEGAPALSEHERLTAGTADLWRQFAVMARGATP